MPLASPQRILQDLTAPRNHVWLTTGIRAVYQRDDANWEAFEQLWEGTCTQVERFKDDSVPPTYRGRFNADGGVMFFKGTDNDQLFERIRQAKDLVDHAGIDGKIRLFYSQQLAAIASTFLADIAAVPKNKPLILAGHSYGGVMALLCGILARNAGWTQVRVFSYGMPRPGDNDFNIGNPVIHIRSVLAGDGITEYGQDFTPTCFQPLTPGTSDVNAFSNHGRKWTLHPFTGQTAQEEGNDQTQNEHAWNYYSSNSACWGNCTKNARIWICYTRETHPIRVYQAAWVLNSMLNSSALKVVEIRARSWWAFTNDFVTARIPETDVLNFHRVIRTQEQREARGQFWLPLPVLSFISLERQTVITRRMLTPPVTR